MIYIGINSEEIENDKDYIKYIGVYVSVHGSDERQDFNSGNIIKDWFYANKYIIDFATEYLDGQLPVTTVTSQFNHLGDFGESYNDLCFGYLHVTNDVAELKYADYTKEDWYADETVTNGIEFIVPSIGFTWEELKKYCDFVPEKK